MSENDQEMITIKKSYYDELMENDLKLSALDAAGVDNWVGYDDAMDIFREWLDENENENEEI
jgi:hypothetical protein